jgi:glycosyltransferase involved in cell wall biosynthesis
MKKNKILHFQLLPILSGVQNVSLNEIEYLKGNFDFELACSFPGPLSDEIQRLGLKTHFFPELKHPINIKGDFITFFKLVQFFRENRYDIVHTHSSKPGFLGRITAKLTGCKKVIHTVHGFAFGFSKNPVKRLQYFLLEFTAARFTDKILVMNAADYKFCKSRLLIPGKKIVFLANGIKDEFFNSTKKDIKGYNFDDGINIVFIGRLSQQKNPMLLLEAFNSLPDEYKEVCNLFYIGDGELRNDLDARVKFYGLEEKVIFMGWQNDAGTLVSNFEIFVLPSNYEGMPLSIIEAMASKVAVIASDISGNRDLIENNITGKLFQSGNVDDLVLSLIDLIKNENQRRELAISGYNKAFSQYRISIHCAQLAKIYNS